MRALFVLQPVDVGGGTGLKLSTETVHSQLGVPVYQHPRTPVPRTGS